MASVVFLSLGLGLAVYGLLLKLPAFSPRRLMIRRLGRSAAPGPVVPALVRSPRRRKMARLTLDWIALLSAQLRAGAPVAAALEGSRHGLQQPLRRQVDRLVADLHATSAKDALQALGARTDSPEVRTVALLLAHHDELGGDLPGALDALEGHVLSAVRRV